jgi:hypothetical protein
LKQVNTHVSECGLSGDLAVLKRFEIIENWQKEIYADTVGDTFYFLDKLAPK